MACCRQGSPPRVRSRLVKITRHQNRVRITSACAEQTISWRRQTRRTRDHLRVCGADDGIRLVSSDLLGSSPRVRSRRTFESVPSVDAGIISACAEQTTGAANHPDTGGDHLRVCGADYGEQQYKDHTPGSSPRVRSRLPGGRRHGLHEGIISACAEQTSSRACRRRSGRDHLRVCGADTAGQGKLTTENGSSPRVRSRPDHEPRVGRWNGIISACAEQTSRLPRLRTRRPDHLRVCGADGKPYDRWEPGGGSSPRVRSRPHLGRGRGGRDRIISACAEQTPRFRCRACRREDHLRVCGADIASLDERARRRGSSPRVRSRPRAAGTPTRRSGIISACAEQTRPRGSSWRPRRDHLRVCGADEVDLFEAMCHQESSPRVRSRPRQRYHGRAGTGIISACAEQTRRPEHALSNIRDHLRVCGADKDADMANRLSAGSSPRVRSRPVKAGGACFGVRIISACAEQTNGADDIERV